MGRPREYVVVPGQRFGRLTVIREYDKSEGHGKWVAACICDCGIEATVTLGNLYHVDTKKRTTSCGCLREEKFRAGALEWATSTVGRASSSANLQRVRSMAYSPEAQAKRLATLRSSPDTPKYRRHGMTHHPLMKIYTGMIMRCYDPNHVSYHNYGGRGISVFAGWRNSPATFICWIEDNLGPRPAGSSLDRFPDKNGNYCPGNVRWATVSEQLKNRRTVRQLQAEVDTLQANLEKAYARIAELGGGDSDSSL